MTEVVDTYRVKRRQNMGGGRWRENGELIPEAHTFHAVHHWVLTGTVDEVKVPVEEFESAIAEYCPELGDRIRAATGLVEGAIIEGGFRSPRTAPLVPRVLPASGAVGDMRPGPPLTRTVRTADRFWIAPSSIAPGIPTPGAGDSLLLQEDEMDRDTRAGRVYEDGFTPDPHELNEALSGTRPEDIERYEAAGKHVVRTPVRTAAVYGQGQDPHELNEALAGLRPELIAGTSSSVPGSGPLDGTAAASSATVPAEHLAAAPQLQGKGGPAPR